MTDAQTAVTRHRGAPVLYWLMVAAVVLISGWVHRQAGLTLPIPWNDESWVLFPALNVAANNTLFAPELNPEKTVLCFPVFTTLMGLLFKVHAGDLEWARNLAWGFTQIGFLAASVWVARLRHPLIFGALAGAFMLSAPLVVAGNIVRPESLMLALAGLSLAAAAHRRYWAVFAAALAMPAVHVGGVMPGGLLALGALGLAWRERRRPGRGEWTALLLAALVVAYYASVILTHWSDAARGYTQAYSHAMTHKEHGSFLSPWLLTFTAPAAGLACIALLFNRPLVLPALLAMGLSMIPAVRFQMWYECYKVWTILLLLLVGGSLLADLLDRRMPAAWPARLVVCVALLPVLLFSYRHGWLEGPNGYPRDMTWGWGMRMSDGTPYLEESDRLALVAALRERFPDATGRLTVLPEGDMMVMRKGLAPFSYFQPVRTSVRADYLIIHESRYKPEWVRHQRLAEKDGFRYARTLHERDGTEKWTLWLRPPPATGPGA